MMSPVDQPLNHREGGKWYYATPPLVRDGTRLSPCDYFGRQMVEKLPENIAIGIINVSIGGVSIDLYMEERVEAFLKTTIPYIRDAAAKYENNPFRYLVKRAKEAKEQGVIKGILFHQGETDKDRVTWPEDVKAVYERLLKELDLKEEDVPILAGEVVRTEMGGMFGEANKNIHRLPEFIKNVHIVSSEGLPCPPDDRAHFTAESYRIFGRRYADEMLKILSKNNK